MFNKLRKDIQTINIFSQVVNQNLSQKMKTCWIISNIKNPEKQDLIEYVNREKAEEEAKKTEGFDALQKYTTCTIFFSKEEVLCMVMRARATQ